MSYKLRPGRGWNTTYLLLALLLVVAVLGAACGAAPPATPAPTAITAAIDTAAPASATNTPLPTEVPATPTPVPTATVQQAAVVPASEDLGILPAGPADGETVQDTPPDSAAPQPAEAVPPAPAQPDTACTPRSDWPTRTVAAGETLSAIARQAGTTVADLVAANCLRSADAILVGQRLYVPAGSAAGSVDEQGDEQEDIQEDAQDAQDTQDTQEDNGDTGPDAGSSTGSDSGAAEPGSGEPVLTQFSADVTTVDRGGTFTITWNVTNTTSAEARLLGAEPRAPRLVGQDLPPSGSLTVTLPADDRHYYQGATISVYATNASRTLRGEGVTSPLVINIRCPYTYFFTPESETCPHAAPADVSAALQRFQNGYMLWRADTGTIFVLPTILPIYSTYSDTWGGGTISFEEAAPEGLLLPQGRFGHLWTTNADVRETLGWATGSPQTYTMRVQVYNAGRYAQFDKTYFTLPDGSLGIFNGPNWQFGR